MKTILIILFFCARIVVSHAQVQELEQLKINLEKLVQLKLMLSQAKQGYQTLQNGYNNVRDAAKGNYDLHKNYLDKLLQVNARVKNIPVLRQISRDAEAVTGEFQKAWREFTASGLFTATELTDMRSNYLQMTGRMSDALDLLSAVLTPNVLRMSDQERLSGIYSVQQGVAAQLDAVRLLINDYEKSLIVRRQQKKDNDALRKLKGIN